MRRKTTVKPDIIYNETLINNELKDFGKTTRKTTIQHYSQDSTPYKKTTLHPMEFLN
jgi:hypothetical protein